MMNARSLAILGVALAVSGIPVDAKVTLDDLFHDNMVLQRDTDAPVWGWADPGEKVTVTLGEQTAMATAGADGYWKATFHDLKPGPVQTLTASGARDRLVVKNVAVGDVWFTSGQSNMQYLLNDQDEIAQPANPDLRYFECPRVVGPQPTLHFPPHAYTWIPAAPGTRAKWSAVAYYFARNLNRELHVPIGIIDCSWGGTPGEPWVAREYLESAPEYRDAIDKAIQAAQNADARVAGYADAYAAWEKQYGRKDPGNKGFADGWAAPAFDAGGWKTIRTSQFNNWGAIGMPDGGAAWLRKTVTLPAGAAGRDLTLNFGEIHAADTVYFNGEEIGHGGWNAPNFFREVRKYTAPGRLVKAGENVIAIRMFVQQSDHAYFMEKSKLALPGVDPSSVTDEWQAQVESRLPPMTPEAAAQQPPNPHPAPGVTPANNFDAMVCPVMPYAIKGALWYQGESNASYGYAYRKLLPLLIAGWRAHWKIGDFPFYVVQLPNLGAPQKDPVEEKATWPLVREAQLLAWKDVPHTGMTVNIDIGEAGNLHPHDKKDVGLRLSLLALGEAYGRKIEYSGPIYDSMTVEGNKIRVKFTHADGLKAKDGGALQRFAIAGSDRKWVAATAAIEGDTVVVSSPAVAAPVAVRYAWAANPDGCNLTNQSGLPASPFRTDDWPVFTQGMWYATSSYEPANDAPLAPLQYPPELEAHTDSGAAK